MPDLKFDGFIYTIDNRFHDLSEIEKDEIYYPKFEKYMVCPSCEKARLTRSHSATGTMFLKTVSGSTHDYVNGVLCYYAQEPAPQYAIKEHIRDLTQTRNLKPKVQSLIRILKSRDLKEKAISKEESLTEALSLKYTPRNFTKEKIAVIPHRSINQWKSIPEDEIVAVFGKVTIKVYKTPNLKDPTKENIYWQIYKLGTDFLLTSVWANPCPTEISDGDYYFAAFATKKIQGKYHNLNVMNYSEGIVVEKII